MEAWAWKNVDPPKQSDIKLSSLRRIKMRNLYFSDARSNKTSKQSTNQPTNQPNYQRNNHPTIQPTDQPSI